MTPKEEAKQLVDSIWKIVEDEMPAKRHIQEVKMLAKLIVDRQIKLLEEEMIACDFNYRSIFIDELKEVKKEIDNL